MTPLSRLLAAIAIALVFPGFAPRADAASLTLAWDANTEPDLAGYLVSFGTSPGQYTQTVDVGLTTTWTLGDAQASQTYYFVVQAYDSAGQRSDYSAEISARAADNAPAPSSPKVSIPRMAVDLPAADAVVNGDFMIAGWAADLGFGTGPGVSSVHVWAYPDPGSGRQPIFVGSADYGGLRSDVAAAFGAPQIAPSGFALRANGLAPGQYELVIYARSEVANAFNNAKVRRIRVEAPESKPRMVIDAPSANRIVGTSFMIAGWALDLGSASGSGISTVHVWAYPASGAAPIFVGVANVARPRADVGRVFGAGFDHAGYDMIASLPPGKYTLAVFAYSSLAKSFNNAATVPITVR